MNKSNRNFLIICILIIIITLGIYEYNSKKFETQSTMSIVNIDTQGSNQNSYIVTKFETTTSKVTTDITTTLISSDTSVSIHENITDISTITTPLDITTSQTVTTTITTTSKTSKDTTITTIPNFPISLNSITLDELQYIKGIGEVTAQKIIDYRNSIGGFTSRYQLLEINGIGEKKMTTIMEYTYIENENLNLESTSESEYNQEPIANNNIIIDEPQYDSSISTDIQNIDISETIEDITTINPYPINLNTATLDDLLLIPNLTPELAQEILNFKDTIQYYSHPYELLYIDGISEEYLSQIIDYIYVE